MRIRRLEAEIDDLEYQMAPDDWRPSRALSRDNLFPRQDRGIDHGIERGIDLGIDL